MARIDESRAFVPVGIAVLTVSDTRTMDTDTSGAALIERIEAAGHTVRDRNIVRDDADAIEAMLRAWIATPNIDVVITTGGTGITGVVSDAELSEDRYVDHAVACAGGCGGRDLSVRVAR